MHECFPNITRTAEIKQDKETGEDGKKSGVILERSNARMKKKEVPTAYQNLINVQ